MTRSPFLKALAGQTLDVPPIWLMRQAGRYLPEYRELRARAGSFVDLCLSPEFATEVTLQPIRRFGFDAAILFADILMVPYGLGRSLRFEEGRGPILEPIRERASVPGFDPDGFHAAVGPIYETVARVRAALGPQTALIGFAGSPWTVASYMVEGGSSRDFAALKLWAYRDPDGFGVLMDTIVEATTAYLDRQIQAGAQAVKLFDSWAGAAPETLFERWVIQPTATIVRRLRALHTDVPIIGFAKGAGALTRGYASATGVTALTLDSGIPLAMACALQAERPVQGNLDPIALLAGGDAMLSEIDRIVDALAGGPFVFNLGHGILPQTPPEHVAALVARVRG